MVAPTRSICQAKVVVAPRTASALHLPDSLPHLDPPPGTTWNLPPPANLHLRSPENQFNLPSTTCLQMDTKPEMVPVINNRINLEPHKTVVSFPSDNRSQCSLNGDTLNKSFEQWQRMSTPSSASSSSHYSSLSLTLERRPRRGLPPRVPPKPLRPSCLQPPSPSLLPDLKAGTGVNSDSGISGAPGATSPQSSLSSISCVGENKRKDEEGGTLLQDSGQWRTFARLLDGLEEFKGLEKEESFLGSLGGREAREEQQHLEEQWRLHCIVVEELGRKLETEASLRERDKFLVHVGEVINRTLLDLLLVFQVRVVTALLASLGWRLAQAQEHQGWHQGGAEKVCVANPDKRRQFFRVQTTIGKHGAG